MAKYMMYLPSEEKLKKEIEVEKEVFALYGLSAEEGKKEMNLLCKTAIVEGR